MRSRIAVMRNRVLTTCMIRRSILQVVLEEAKSPDSQTRKTRFISGIMTPAQPDYLYGQVDAKGDMAKDIPSGNSLVAVASSVGGYKVLHNPCLPLSSTRSVLQAKYDTASTMAMPGNWSVLHPIQSLTSSDIDLLLRMSCRLLRSIQI